MEMNNDIFTPDLPIPEPVEFEDAPVPAPVEEEKPAETSPHRWEASSRPTAARRLQSWTTTASALSSPSKK